jgi:hypothetical protein
MYIGLEQTSLPVNGHRDVVQMAGTRDRHAPDRHMVVRHKAIGWWSGDTAIEWWSCGRGASQTYCEMWPQGGTNG